MNKKLKIKLKELTIEELNKLKAMIKDYRAKSGCDDEELQEIDNVLSKTTKLPIILNLLKNGFKRLVSLTEYYNIWTDKKYDDQLENINLKLAKRYRRLFKEDL